MATAETIRTVLATLLGATATIMAVSVGIVSVVPALLELVRSRGLEYFAREDLREHLTVQLRRIAHSIWLFGVVLLLCLEGLFLPSCTILVLTSGLWVVTIGLLLLSAFRIALLAIDSLTIGRASE